MTCREKLLKIHPEEVDPTYTGGCFGCPHNYLLMEKPSWCACDDKICTKCWDRELPTETPTDKATEPTEDMVNHPSHYTNGGMECIDEMVLIFGKEATMNFCLCNAWKYRRRALYKNGEEDIQKSHWYINKYRELKGESA